MKEVLSEYQFDYEYLNITSNLFLLKSFMKLRDTEDAFKEVREKHSVGIPCLVTDSGVYVTEGRKAVEALIMEGLV